MDNMYQPPGGDQEDLWRTQRLGAAAGPAGQGQAGPRGRRPSRSGGRRRLRWTAGIALAALLAAGGGIAAAQLVGNSTSGATGPAAVLNTALTSPNSADAMAAAAGQPAATSAVAPLRGHPCLRAARVLYRSGHPLAARAALRACRLRLLRRRILAGIHGEFTFETAYGPRTLAFERGVIQSVTSTAIVVRAIDGTTWTWDLVSNTVIRENHEQASANSLATGELVFAGGPVVNGAYDARLIVIHPATEGSGSSAPGGSASGS
jgi:hypothetical protein